jgi:hypothetical protein
MGFILEILSFLFQGGLLGRGEEEKELREKIKTLEARPQHLPEDILLLERDRFARKLYWIYLVVGISAFWIILLSVQIVFSEMVAPTQKWIMDIGKDLKDFLYILPGIAVVTFVAGIPFIVTASWSRRFLYRALHEGVPEKLFRKRTLHTKIVFTGTFLFAVFLYGSAFRDPEAGLEVVFLPLLLSLGAFLWYLCGFVILKLQGEYHT